MPCFLPDTATDIVAVKHLRGFEKTYKNAKHCQTRNLAQSALPNARSQATFLSSSQPRFFKILHNCHAGLCMKQVT